MSKPIELRIDHYVNGSWIETWEKAKLVRVVTKEEFLVRRADGMLEFVRSSKRIREITETQK